MSPGHCSCPECGTTLRVRDRSFVGRVIECPDCQAKLLIKWDDDRKLVAERPKIEAAPSSSQRLAVPVAKVGSALGEKIRGLARSPLALAWALAIGLTAFVAILMLRPSVRFRTPTPTGETSPSVAATDSTGSQTSPENKPETTPPDATSEDSPSVTTANPRETPTDPQVGTKTPGITPAPVPESPPIVTSTGKPKTTDGVPATNDVTGPNDTPAANPPTTLKPAPVAVKIDVDARLQQRLLQFEMKQPKSRQQMIELVEELFGAPIRYNRGELGGKNLDQTISINLEATTVGGVLKAILEPAGWEYVVEDTGIRLKPRRVADSPTP